MTLHCYTCYMTLNGLISEIPPKTSRNAQWTAVATWLDNVVLKTANLISELAVVKESHIYTYIYNPLCVFQELKRVDLDRFWNPLLYIDNILSETKEATWLTGTCNSRGEAYIMERRRVRGVFMENLELNDFPLDVQVTHDSWVRITTTPWSLKRWNIFV